MSVKSSAPTGQRVYPSNKFVWIAIAGSLVIASVVSMKGEGREPQQKVQVQAQQKSNLNLYAPRKPPQDVEFVLHARETSKWVHIPFRYRGCVSPGRYELERRDFLGNMNPDKNNVNQFRIRSKSDTDIRISIYFVPASEKC